MRALAAFAPAPIVSLSSAALPQLPLQNFSPVALSSAGSTQASDTITFIWEAHRLAAQERMLDQFGFSPYAIAQFPARRLTSGHIETLVSLGFSKDDIYTLFNRGLCRDTMDDITRNIETGATPADMMAATKAQTQSHAMLALEQGTGWLARLAQTYLTPVVKSIESWGRPVVQAPAHPRVLRKKQASPREIPSGNFKRGLTPAEKEAVVNLRPTDMQSIAENNRWFTPGRRDGATVLYYTFDAKYIDPNTRSSSQDVEDVRALNDIEQKAVLKALAERTRGGNIIFQELPDNSLITPDVIFRMAEMNHAYGGYTMGNTITGSTHWHGNHDDLYAIYMWVHELGHELGFAHPFNGGGTSSMNERVALPEHNVTDWTVMAYNTPIRPTKNDPLNLQSAVNWYYVNVMAAPPPDRVDSNALAVMDGAVGRAMYGAPPANYSAIDYTLGENTIGRQGIFVDIDRGNVTSLRSSQNGDQPIQIDLRSVAEHAGAISWVDAFSQVRIAPGEAIGIGAHTGNANANIYGNNGDNTLTAGKGTNYIHPGRGSNIIRTSGGMRQIDVFGASEQMLTGRSWIEDFDPQKDSFYAGTQADLTNMSIRLVPSPHTGEMATEVSLNKPHYTVYLSGNHTQTDASGKLTLTPEAAATFKTETAQPFPQPDFAIDWLPLYLMGGMAIILAGGTGLGCAAITTTVCCTQSHMVAMKCGANIAQGRSCSDPTDIIPTVRKLWRAAYEWGKRQWGHDDYASLNDLERGGNGDTALDLDLFLPYPIGDGLGEIEAIPLEKSTKEKERPMRHSESCPVLASLEQRDAIRARFKKTPADEAYAR